LELKCNLHGTNKEAAAFLRFAFCILHSNVVQVVLNIFVAIASIFDGLLKPWGFCTVPFQIVHKMAEASARYGLSLEQRRWLQIWLAESSAQKQGRSSHRIWSCPASRFARWYYMFTTHFFSAKHLLPNFLWIFNIKETICIKSV
jgi:hypothetical protein